MLGKKKEIRHYNATLVNVSVATRISLLFSFNVNAVCYIFVKIIKPLIIT